MHGMCFMKWLASYGLLLLCLMSATALAENSRDNEASQKVQGPWMYHLGDLPRDPVTQSWLFQQGNWQETDNPEGLPERTNERIAWIKTTLPKSVWRDPYLFISSIDLTAEVFQNNQKLYHFGEIDEAGNSRFQGWPWHMIRLPDNYDQQDIYIRVFSDYPFLGLSGDVMVGDRFDLLNQVYYRGIYGLFFILIVLVIGVVSTVIGMIKKDKRAAVSTGFLSLNLSLMMFAENELSQVVWFEPLIWRYVAAFSYFLIPALLSIVVSAWLKDKTLLLARVVKITSLCFFVGVAFLSMFTEFNFVNAYPYFDALFIILVLSLLLAYGNKFRYLGTPGILMMVGVLTLFLSLLADMLSAHGFIDWIGHAGQWGLILFTLSAFMIYLVQDWNQQIDLNELTNHLETKVKKRTAELQESQAALERLAREDDLTGLLNRRAFKELARHDIVKAIRYQQPLSLLLFDIDLFKSINDKFGHNVGDQVLVMLADAAKKICRENELICRFGGEEFVVLLPSTYSESALLMAQRLKDAIREIQIDIEGDELSITASFGLVTIKGSDLLNDKSDKLNHQPDSVLEALLIEADKVMYDVKTAGRDDIKAVEINELST